MVSGETQERARRDMTSLSFRRLRLGGLLVWASLVTTLMGAPAARAQHFLGEETASIATSSYRTVDGLGAHDIVARMIERNRLRQEELQSYSVVRTYEIQNQDGRLAAQAVVSVDYRAPGTKTFHKVSEKGSWVVRHMVFDRLLQSEEETSSGHERSEAAIFRRKLQLHDHWRNNSGVESLLYRPGPAKANRQVPFRRTIVDRRTRFWDRKNLGPPG